MEGTLYLVATPIGNLDDFSFRALETLKNVDFILCEDTRHTLQLLTHFNIKKRVESFYREIEEEKCEFVINELLDGKNIALVSDAGMPCINDPGSILVQKLIENNLKYTVIPGPSAVVCAVALSGVIGPFCYLGFLPEKYTQRETILRQFENISCNLIVYVAPHDILKLVEDLKKILGNRKVHIIKEITKIHETVISGYLEDISIENPKGEFVIVIEKSEIIKDTLSDNTIIELLKEKINQGISKKDAIVLVAKENNISKNLIYKLATKI
ncbi:MAG: 16S rRNA (cytidine(1402)-2'-O)-methyltransferase [Clostridia bacterium]|nr:16S rRNA (cytidine(1402)-2'-O)-methyltransferase [Clostridia bacterium]